MRVTRRQLLVALVALAGAVSTSCAPTDDLPPPAIPRATRTPAPKPAASAGTPAAKVNAAPGSSTAAEKVKLQLRWLPQAQFAGYYVAQERGYFRDEQLDVMIVPGGPDTVVSERVTGGQADFGVEWVASILANREKGQAITIVSQLFQMSSQMLVSRKSANIARPEDLRGRRVGVWFGGNEYEFLALMDKLKLDIQTDVVVVKQGFSMDAFLDGQIEAASATTYNELQVVLESGVPADELNVIDYNAEGVGMLQDCLFTREDLARNKKDLVTRFVRASVRGWQAAVDDQAAAVETVLKHIERGSSSADHQRRMLAEVAKLVVPTGWSREKIGQMDEGRFKQTADIALKFKVIGRPASPAEAYTNEFVLRAAGKQG